MRTYFFVVVWALICVLCVASARADAPELEAAAGRFALGGSVGIFGDAQATSSVYVTTYRLGALYAIDERFAVTLDAGMVLLRSSPSKGDGDWAVRPGNPTGFGLMRGAWGDLRYQFGVGAAAPIATVKRDGAGPLQHAALNYAAAIDGLWNEWQWATNRTAAIVRSTFELPVVDKSWLVLTLAPTVYFPAWEDFGDDSVDVVLPLALSFGARHRVVWFGARGQAVIMPMGDPDMLQLAVGPFIRVVIGSGFIEARTQANLDEPLAGKRGPGIWGLHVGGGGAL